VVLEQFLNVSCIRHFSLRHFLLKLGVKSLYGLLVIVSEFLQFSFVIGREIVNCMLFVLAVFNLLAFKLSLIRTTQILNLGLVVRF